MRYYALLAALPLLAAGCRQDQSLNAYVDAMRAEYLQLESNYYSLENEYQMKVAELEALKRQTVARTTSGSDSGSASDDESGTEEYAPPKIEFGTPEPPKLDFGTPIDPGDLTPGGGTPSSSSVPKAPGTPTPAPRLNEGSMLPGDIESIDTPLPLDSRVTHIVINPQLTGGYDFDRKPGDDGIVLLVEPRNADDRFVPATGELSISVIDREAAGDAGYVAMWKFAAEHTKLRLKTGEEGEGRGFSFKLPWPDQRPEHRSLHVFVRLELEDGRKLQADLPFELAMPGEFSNRWTPTTHSFSRRSANRDANDSPAATSPVQQVQYVEEVPGTSTKPPVSDSVPDAANSQRASSGSASKSASRPVWSPYR